MLGCCFFCICCTAQSFSFLYYPGKTLISFNCTFFSAILGVCSLCYPADSGGFPWFGKFAYPLYWQQSRSPSRTDYCFRLPERPSAPTNGWKTQAACTRKGVLPSVRQMERSFVNNGGKSSARMNVLVRIYRYCCYDWWHEKGTVQVVKVVFAECRLP